MGASDLQYRFDRNLESLAGSAGCRILAAVSGGPDSMLMATLLYNTSLDVRFDIAHMNFNLRPGFCDSDQALVEKWAAGHSVRCFTKSVDTATHARNNGISIEMAARELRYEWFGELAGKYGYDYVAIAHNANDNAETLLLNLVRGTGFKGICGMREVDRERKILRPMLIFERSEIESCIRELNVGFATDKTNFSNEYSRNRIRNVVLEELKHINPSVVATLNRDILRFSHAYRVLEYCSDNLLKEFLFEKHDFEKLIDSGLSIPMAARKLFAKAERGYFEAALAVEKMLGIPGWEYLLHSVLSRYGFNGPSVEAIVISLDRLQQRLSGSAIMPEHETDRTKIYKSADYVAVLERGFVKIFSTAILEAPDSSDIVLDGMLDRGAFRKIDKSLHFGNLLLNLSVVHKDDIASLISGGCGVSVNAIARSLAGDGVLTVDFDRLSAVHDAYENAGSEVHLHVRRCMDGDRFRPLGLKGRKSVMDYFTDIKTDNLLKNRLPVLLVENEIVALPGLQIDDKFKVSNKTTRFLVISIS